MRAFAQRPLLLAIVSLVAVLSGRALAQSATPAGEVEEVTVRGRKTLEQYRLELEQAREDLVEAYNEANSSDDNDITCRNERPTGSRMPQRVCRSNAQSEAEANASRDFLRALTHSAGNFRNPDVAIGAQVNASIGAAGAQIDEATLSAGSRAEIEAELERLKKEDRQVYRAVVRYLELEDEYNRARGAVAEQ
jgi:hypothetical protein